MQMQQRRGQQQKTTITQQIVYFDYVIVCGRSRGKTECSSNLIQVAPTRRVATSYLKG